MFIILLAHEKCGALVKRSRRRPLTAESRVRFPDALPRIKNGFRPFFSFASVLMPPPFPLIPSSNPPLTRSRTIGICRVQVVRVILTGFSEKRRWTIKCDVIFVPHGL